MKIGDKILVRGIVDEIRKDVVIIHNEGGYFVTKESEIKHEEKFIEDCKLAFNGIETCLKTLVGLENEYEAYHATLYQTGEDSDYWRGVRYALDVIEEKMLCE